MSLVDILQKAEEVFFERHFEYGDDEETMKANYESALEIYFRSYKESSELAEKICDGEVVDIPIATLALQNLIFSHKYVGEFKKALGSSDAIINIEEISLNGMSTEVLTDKGNSLLESGKSKNQFAEIEKGKYLLYAAAC